MTPMKKGIPFGRCGRRMTADGFPAAVPGRLTGECALAKEGAARSGDGVAQGSFHTGRSTWVASRASDYYRLTTRDLESVA